MMLSTELIPQGQNGGNDPIEDDKGARLYRQAFSDPLHGDRGDARDHRFEPITATAVWELELIRQILDKRP